MAEEYTNHHYVPQWYQKKFMLTNESELFYLRLKPDSFYDKRGIVHEKKSLYRQGSKKCFFEKDLYTAEIGSLISRDIEKHFFGEIDRNGRNAVEYFTNFNHYNVGHDEFQHMLMYMSTQKLRTLKGLKALSQKLGGLNNNEVLRAMIGLQSVHSAIWTECVWFIADATESDTKFIISDHPVTVYNREYGPKSDLCRGVNDPEIWNQGTHTIFPLSLNKILILTNLSWVRNPYQSAKGNRPNAQLMRNAMFKFTDIQIDRKLNESEVREINFVLKKRAYKFIAAAERDWLYPEKYVSKSNWNIYGHGYLFMPDPRPIHLGGEIFGQNKDGTSFSFDVYGRQIGDPDYNKEQNDNQERITLDLFKGEFATIFGPQRRGVVFDGPKCSTTVDSEEFHKYHLNLHKSNKERRMILSKLY